MGEDKLFFVFGKGVGPFWRSFRPWGFAGLGSRLSKGLGLV